MRKIYHKIFSENTRKNIRYWLNKGKSLDFLASFYDTDKFGHHFYTQHYQRHFAHLRNEKINLLEIGIGGWSKDLGWSDSHKGGNSLRMWKAFFPKGNIFGIDIHDKSPLEESRIKTFQGSQVDEGFLKSVIDSIGSPNIIIDDGSHFTFHQIETFKILFPLLTSPGIYVIEDLFSSYWESTDNYDWRGSSNLSAPFTTINYLKSLIDGLNYAERGIEPKGFDTEIFGLHFYHNLCFIEKNANSEPSSLSSRLETVNKENVILP